MQHELLRIEQKCCVLSKITNVFDLNKFVLACPNTCTTTTTTVAHRLSH